jgi:hypothetical protein
MNGLRELFKKKFEEMVFKKKKESPLVDELHYWNIAPTYKEMPEPYDMPAPDFTPENGKIKAVYPEYEEYQDPETLFTAKAPVSKSVISRWDGKGKHGIDPHRGIKGKMKFEQMRNQYRRRKLLERKVPEIAQDSQNKYNKSILRWADSYNRKYGKAVGSSFEEMPAGLVKAIIQAESTFNPDAVGRDNDSGLMQLLPGSQEELRKTYGQKFHSPFLSNSFKDYDSPSIFDPDTNIRGGIKWLMQKRYESYPDLVDKGEDKRERLRRWVQLFNGWKNGGMDYADKVMPIYENNYLK